MRSVGRYTILTAALILILSCQRNKTFQPSWNTQVSAPIFSSTLTFSNIVGDTLVKKNPDSSLQLVFDNQVYSFNPDSQAIKIPDTTTIVGYNINNLQIANDSLTYPFSLGQFALTLEASSNFTDHLEGAGIIAENGGSSTVPALTGISSSYEPVNANNLFEAAKIKSGGIKVSIYNGFPIELNQLIFELFDSVSLAPIASDTFTNIPIMQSQSNFINLAGKTVKGSMLAKIVNLASNGSPTIPVPIDTSDKIIVSFKTQNILVDSATANFSSQNIINQTQAVTYNLSGGAQLKEMRVKSGTLNIKINSTIGQVTYFTYSLPSAFNGTSKGIVFSQTLPAGSPGKPNAISQSINLAGYTIGLTGNGHQYNTYLNVVKVSIDSTGKPITLSYLDSVTIDYGLVNIVPDYVSGYLGQQIVQVGPSTSAINVFNKIKSGSVSLQNVQVNLGIVNGLGADGRITLYQLQSIRSSNNSTVNLTSPTVMNQPLFIPRAVDTLTPSNTNFSLIPSNSNILNWVENMPNKILYRMDVFLNPNGNTDHYGDFAYTNTRIDVNMDLQMPLSFIANQLELVDTIPFSLGNNKTIEHIQSGVFHLICNNGLPLSAALQVSLYDVTGAYLTDLVVSGSTIAPAPLDNNCKVSATKETVIDIPVTAVQMQKIKDASKAVITATFNTTTTSTCSSYLKIYSTYTLGCKLTGNFTYFTGE